MRKKKKYRTTGAFGMGAGVFEEIFAPNRHEAAQYLETKKLLPIEQLNDDSNNPEGSIFEGKIVIDVQES